MDSGQSTKFMYDLLRLMLSKKGSDLFITADFPPAMKLDGKMTPVMDQKLTGQHTADLVRAMMNDKQAAEFEATKECNFAIAPAGIGRFRVNCFVQQGKIGMVLRTKARCRPLFISPGHKVDLETAVDLVLRCLRGYRLPEPTRLADRLAGATLRHTLIAGASHNVQGAHRGRAE